MSTFSLALIKTLFQTYTTQVAEVGTARQAMNALGPRPVLPMIVDADADVNDTLAAQDEWDENMAPLKETFVTESNYLQTVVESISNASPANEWMLLAYGVDPVNTNLQGNHWIGHDGKTVTHVTVLPTQPFPLT